MRVYMKTITEFPGMNLKNAAKVKSDLVAAGKSPEELPQAMGEALKLEGDRLNFLIGALEIIGTKFNDLKRTVVYTLNEGEKVPPGMTQKENYAFSIEYYPSLEKPKPKGQFPEGRGDGKRRGKKGKGRGGRDDRPRRNPRRAPADAGNQPKEGASAAAGPQKKVIIKPISSSSQ
jgi:hypothetical protein